jgi:hypothetical protein
MAFAKLCIALAFILAGVTTPVAQEMPAAVTQWYQALRAADREAFAALMAPDARIDLRDLGIVQTRDEFIESLDSWEDAMEGGSIETKTVESPEAAPIVEVCYRFPANQQHNRETFTLDGATVAGVVQETIAGDCAGF